MTAEPEQACADETGAPVDPERRAFMRVAGMSVAGVGVLASQLLPSPAMAADASLPVPPGSLDTANIVNQPRPQPDPSRSTADIIVETLIAWEVPFVFGMVGDGIGGLIEALRKRQKQIRFIGVRHEEAAAFMASGYAKATGRLGVCVATTGPGAVHLMNGLYDASFDGAPVLAITGTTFHDLIGTRFMQSVDTVALMKDVAVYNTQVTSAGHALIVGDLACRAALAKRGVAHLTIPKDVQTRPLADDKPSMENHGLRTSASWLPTVEVPPPAQLQQAADLLNAGKKVAILAGQGAAGARAELEQVADLLGAPIAKALLGRCVLPDASPFSTGGIGHLGTLPSEQVMHECDTLLILGSTMPWIDSYPRPGQARAVQVDRDPARLGLRYPMEIGLTGDVRATLQALLPLLHAKPDRAFLTSAQSRMTQWRALLKRIEQDRRTPLRPQAVVAAFGALLQDTALIALDCGANTHFAARHLELKEGQTLIATGMLATMAPGLPYAVAAKLAWPDRQSVAIVGDGGFAMLMAELSTAVRLDLAVKILVLRNDSLAEVVFEQRDAGNPVFGCELGPIDFVKIAEACGAEGYRITTADDLPGVLQAALSSTKAAVIEARVDPGEAPLRPAQLVG